MGNKKNERKRLPTAKKLAADLTDPADPPRHSSSSTRPKPRPTYKGSTKNPKPSEPISKKARQSQAVTSESDMDASDASDDAGEDEVIEIEEDEDGIWDEDDEDEEDEEDVEVKGKVTAQAASATRRSAPAKKDDFLIPFEVRVNDRYKELHISYNATWEAAQIIIGKKVLRDPETLSLGYINPFKARGTGKAVPSSLENADEWNGLIQHVKTFLSREKAKNRGKGGLTKPWTIVLVDSTLGKDSGQIASKTNAKGSKNIEPKQVADDTSQLEGSAGSDSHTFAEICRRHHCDRCGKACFIDPGPPPAHKPFTMQQLSVWTSLVKLKSATIDQVPDILNLPKRKDREPLPPQAGNPSEAVSNTMTTNSTAGNDSQGYTHLNHLGFPMHPGPLHGFPPFPPSFPMQTPAYPYPMPNYPTMMPGPMYAPPYGYPFAPQGATHATSTMQPNRFPAPAAPPFMQNYHMPNYPMPTPMYAPPVASGYPFAMPAPAAPPGLGQLDSEGANIDSGRKRQFSVSGPQASGSGPIEAGMIPPNTDPTSNDWLNDTYLPPVDTPEA